jgi:hypothetical protein
VLEQTVQLAVEIAREGRGYDQQEIDLVEEREGRLFGHEFKWSQTKSISPPKDWLSTYSNADYRVITKENYQEILLPKA